MSAVQITVENSTPWVQSVLTAFFPPFLAASAALGAVWLTSWLNHKRAQKSEMLDRGMSALALAEHLEDFVIHCSEVVQSQQSVVWDNPYDLADYSDSPLWFGGLPAWPALLDWRHLGFNLAVKANNFRRKVQFAQGEIRSMSEHLDGEETHALAAENAADLGLQAWDLAVETRREAGLAAFEWPREWSAVEYLERHKAGVEERRFEAAKHQSEF